MSEQVKDQELQEEPVTTTEEIPVDATESAKVANVSPDDELVRAKQEIESLKDSWARERAEFQNFKRRTSHDYMNIKREAVKVFVTKLLTPLDNLERVGTGINATDEMKPFIDGVEMIKKEFFFILEKENVLKLNPKGEVFDPMSMEAIASEESEEFSEETVLEVYQCGYAIQENNEKIMLRPARVKVGRPKI